MEIIQITSRQNRLVKQFSAIAGDGALRRESGLAALEGARLCADAAASDVPVEAVFFTAGARERYAQYLSSLLCRAKRVYEVSGPVAEKMSSVKHPQGVFCLCRFHGPEAIDSMTPSGRYLAVEHLQDPSNLGAVMRTAEALGITGLLLAGKCCDPFSPKALRASMGAAFRLPMFEAGALPQALYALRKKGIRTYAAVADRTARCVLETDFSHGAVLAVGNEGNGLSLEAVEACELTVTIPMPGRAESLNAAAAATILMWEMMRC